MCVQNKGHSIRRQYMGMGRIWESSYRKFMSKLSGSQSHFREKIMDSPAIRLEGPTEPSPNNQRYTSDTLGIHLYPEFSAYPYTAHAATFVLFNQSEYEIESGDPYWITYEDQHGVWRTLPIHTVFNSIAYSIQPGKQFLFKANLNPNVLPNRPGRYRFFYEVELMDKKQKSHL